MASPPKIRIMVSSRCNDPIAFNGSEAKLSDVRQKLKAELEGTELFGGRLFDVWINEDAPPAEGSSDSWDHCLQQVREANIVLVLYNGNSGWAPSDGDIGICHAELSTALSTAAAKVRVIAMPLRPVGETGSAKRDKRFRDFVDNHNRFYGHKTKTGEEVIEQCRVAVRESVVDMVRLGVREASRGKFHTGDALEWSQLDFAGRRKVMEDALRRALLERDGGEELNDQVFVSIASQKVLASCHGVPASLTVAAARELIGQPFVRDYELAGQLDDSHVGPIHVFACHRTATEAQAIRQLGMADITTVAPPFGIYAVDHVNKVQVVLISGCRDETTVRHGVQRFLDWLKQTGEAEPLSRRAAARARIVKAIADEMH